MIINHNISALNAHRQLGANQNSVQGSLEKLSSGLRINRAGDDAAGLAISEKMRGQIRGLEMATKNAQDGISLIQTAEGALNETHSILQRMRELAVQSSNDTNTTSDREEIQKEVDQLAEELSRIGNNTEFNTQNLLDGSFEGTFQIGANSDQNINLEINDMRARELKVVGTAEVVLDPDAPVATVSGTYTAATQDGDATTTNSIVDGTYTIEEDSSSPGTYNLVNDSGTTVATSADGITFIGDGKDGGDGAGSQLTEELVFGSAVTAGTVEISSSGATVTATPAPTTLTNDGLEAGEYSVKTNANGGLDLVGSNGKTIATSSDGGMTFSNDNGSVLSSSNALANGDKVKVGGIDVSSQTSANTAITKINDAIETVSAERSKLGAYQNRLDHTINNLGTSAENLTAAESRIRDVDMAKEMMEFTKNNILSQAAQSMLAQANQQPQGVLQLLQ